MHKNILVYDILYKALFSSKTLRISFVEVDGFIRVYDGIRCTSLFGLEKNNAIYNRIEYLISEKYFYQDKVRKNWSGGL